MGGWVKGSVFFIIEIVWERLLTKGCDCVLVLFFETYSTFYFIHSISFRTRAGEGGGPELFLVHFCRWVCNCVVASCRSS